MFISYSRTDLDYVDRLADHLSRGGVTPHYDKHLRAGDDWPSELEEWVNTCRAFILVMSPAAAKSTWVRREILKAQAIGVPIRPLLLAGRPLFSVIELQHEDVRGGRMPTDTFVRQLRQLCGADSAVEFPAPDPAQPRAGKPLVAVGTPALSSLPLGRLGTRQINTILRPGGATPPAIDRWTIEDLDGVDLTGLPADQARKARRTVEALALALRTVHFLQTAVPGKATTAGLVRALHSSNQSVAPEALDELASVTDYVEYVALHYKGGRSELLAWMAQFLISLINADDGAVPPDLLVEWAAGVDGLAQLNDAWRRWRISKRNDRVRLIVSLHASPAGDWPESVSAWCVKDGIPSPLAPVGGLNGQSDVEGAIRHFVRLARSEAELADSALKHIDVVVPTGMLARWRPEEVIAGRRLFVDSTVHVRWSDRLRDTTPDQLLRSRLAAVRESRYEWLDWLDRREARDLAALNRRVVNGDMAKATGLRFHPANDDSLHTVLQTSPVLVWPDPDADPTITDQVELCWPDLPQRLADAYRIRGDSPDRPPPLAAWRAVYDDEAWLDFCRALRGHK